MFKNPVIQELERENEELAEELIACLSLTIQMSVLVDALAEKYDIPEDTLVELNESITYGHLLDKAADANIVQEEYLEVLEEFFDHLEEINEPIARHVPAFAKREQGRIDKKNKTRRRLTNHV